MAAKKKVVKEEANNVNKYKVNVLLNLRKEPSKEAPIVKMFKAGEIIEVESIENGWAKTKGGYVMEQYITAE